MDIDVIVSTMNNKPQNLSETLLNYRNLTVINQVPNKLSNDINERYYKNIKWIDVDQKGLSKSRNLGLNVSESPYIYLTDDDIVLEDEFQEIVTLVANEYPFVDIFAFQVDGIEDIYKVYPKNERNITYYNSLKLSSVQLVMKKSFIKKNNLQYDEMFGAGSEYKMGEENIFLFDALKKGAKIKYIPKRIARVHLGDSSWFKGFNEEYLLNRGAILYRMSPTFYLFLIIQFSIRKRKLFPKLRLRNIITYQIEGAKKYKKQIKEKMLNNERGE